MGEEQAEPQTGLRNKQLAVDYSRTAAPTDEYRTLSRNSGGQPPQTERVSSNFMLLIRDETIL